VRALITGGGGQLGRDLAAQLGPDSARSFSHEELDIGDEAAVGRAFAEVEPDVVFN
jgi:dTDP-4-dehydrorhamnose reductase